MRTHKQLRAGMAMLLVLLAMAVAAMIGCALLWSASSQAQTGANAAAAAKADSVAESGFEAVLYYLEYPKQAPAGWTNTSGYTLCANNVPIVDPQGANYSVAVWSTGIPNQYSVQVNAQPFTNSPMTRTITAVVSANWPTIPAAGVFGSAVTLSTGWTFVNSLLGGLAVQLTGILSLLGGVLGGGSTQVVTPSTASSAYVVPDNTTVNYFGDDGTSQYTMPDFATPGTPQPTSGTSISSPPSVNPATNPGAVFYSNGGLTINGNVTINGTLVVRGGPLVINGTVTINAQAGMPAIVTDNAIDMGANDKLTANGAVYAGGGVNWAADSSGANLTINGALVLPSGVSLGSTNNGSATVNYFTSGSANTQILPTYAQSVTVVIWGATMPVNLASNSGGGGNTFGGGGNTIGGGAGGGGSNPGGGGGYSGGLAHQGGGGSVSQGN